MEKEISRALRPFQKKLAAEAALRAVCVSGLFALPVWLALALARRCFGGAVGRPEALMLPVWALLAAALYALRYRPTQKRLAARLDALCGMDRVATAMEFSGDSGVLCRLQREDTADRLEKTDVRALPMRWPKKALAACCVLAAMIAAVPLLSEAAVERVRALVAAAAPEAQQESEEIAALREMMQTLRADVAESDIDATERDKLVARLDELLTRLDEGYADIAAVQEIRDAMTGMEQTVQELTPRDTYTAAMIEYESLQKLGEAIYDQNMDTVVMILDSMGRRLHEKTGMEQVDALMNLVYDVNGSLAKPLRDNSQEQLRQAMMMFAGGLESAAEMVYNGRDNTQMIDTALETVETYIRDYLGVPEEGERYDPFAHMDYGKGSKPSGAPSAEAANVEKPKSRMETEYVYDPPEALKASGYQPGALNERGERQRLSADTRERPMGAVPYGEVYGRYYAAYLSMIEDETFPQALREAAQAYMNGL